MPENFNLFDELLDQLSNRALFIDYLLDPDFLILLRDALSAKAATSNYSSNEYNLALDLFGKAYPKLALPN